MAQRARTMGRTARTGAPMTPPVSPQLPGPGSPPLQPPGTQPPAPPTPPTPLLNPGVAGTSVTPFGPTAGDLQGGFISPSQSVRGTAASGRTDAAVGTAAGFNLPTAVGGYNTNFRTQLQPTDVEFNGMDTDLHAGDAVNPEDSADLAQFRTMRSGAANNLTNGRSRSEIAQAQMEAFDLENSQGVKDLQREMIQRSAAGGRLGLGDDQVASLRPFVDMMNRRNALAKQLGAETAEGEISDRMNNLTAARGLVGEEEGIGASRRGEQRTERDYTTDIDDTNIQRRLNERDAELGLTERNTGRTFDANRAALEMATGLGGVEQAGNLARVNTLAGVEGDIYGREADQREEVRDERDFQTMTGRQALEDALRERDYNDVRGPEGDLAWNRQFADRSIEEGLSPSGVYLGGAGQYGAGGAAASGAAGDLLGQWLGRERRQRQPAGG